jgi:hypothetical protein
MKNTVKDGLPSNGTANVSATDHQRTPTEPAVSQAPTAAKKRFCGKPGRSGAPRGNSYATKHGLRSAGIKTGMMPKGARYIQHRINALRRELEAAVVAAKGEVSLVDAATIQTAVKYEAHGCLAQRWLRLNEGEMKPLERLQFSREIANASSQRDKAIAALELGRNKQFPWLEEAASDADVDEPTDNTADSEAST